MEYPLLALLGPSLHCSGTSAIERRADGQRPRMRPPHNSAPPARAHPRPPGEPGTHHRLGRRLNPTGPRTSSTDELGASASGGGGNQFSATFSSLRSPGYLRSCRRRRRPCEPLTSAPPTRRCHSRTSMKRQLSQVARTPQFRMRGRAWGGSLTRAAPRLLGAFSGSQFAKRE